jgi:hypothetical protein
MLIAGLKTCAHHNLLTAAAAAQQQTCTHLQRVGSVVVRAATRSVCCAVQQHNWSSRHAAGSTVLQAHVATTTGLPNTRSNQHVSDAVQPPAKALTEIIRKRTTLSLRPLMRTRALEAAAAPPMLCCCHRAEMEDACCGLGKLAAPAARCPAATFRFLERSWIAAGRATSFSCS